MTWTSWMTWGRVNYQQKFFLKVNYSFKRIALWDTVYSAYV